MLTEIDFQQMLVALLQGWEVMLSSLTGKGDVRIRLAPKAFGFERQLDNGAWVPVAIGLANHTHWKIADMGQPKVHA